MPQVLGFLVHATPTGGVYIEGKGQLDKDGVDAFIVALNDQLNNAKTRQKETLQAKLQVTLDSAMNIKAELADLGIAVEIDPIKEIANFAVLDKN